MAMWSLLTGLMSGATLYDMTLDFPMSLPLQTIITGAEPTPAGGTTLRIKDIMALGWCYMMMVLCTLSVIRVARHVQSTTVFASALSKLASPALLCIAALLFTETQSTTGNPSIRFQLLSLGFAMCLITIKMIVFSMAHMSYASFQFSVVPYVLVRWALWFVADRHPSLSSLIDPLVALGYLVQLLHWIQMAISQLLERLQIQLFRIASVPKKAE